MIRPKSLERCAPPDRDAISSDFGHDVERPIGPSGSSGCISRTIRIRGWARRGGLVTRGCEYRLRASGSRAMDARRHTAQTDCGVVMPLQMSVLGAPCQVGAGTTLA